MLSRYLLCVVNDTRQYLRKIKDISRE